jgi:hypothetical protein
MRLMPRRHESRPMSIVRKIKKAVRGEVAAKTVALEALRRSRVAIAVRRERASLKRSKHRGARLSPPFRTMAPVELLSHFRQRTTPVFLPGFSSQTNASDALQQLTSPEAKQELLAAAKRIVREHTWPLLGIGEKNFGHPINWHRDPVSGFVWPVSYHADINLNVGGGSDVRVLWELNRLPHLITLAQAYALTNDEQYVEEFLQQVESWHTQNPYGYGANWNCAMEVALRAINLLGAFEVFRRSQNLDEKNVATLLAVFDDHGWFIETHLEFSYIATSNHYLSDVVGLVWLGVMLPELEGASRWRSVGLRQMLREMDKQVLNDGADFEASTGYHRFVLELFLYTFTLCRANDIEIPEPYWKKLKAMLRYVRGYLRPDGRAPLIGDSDSGQVFPTCRRSADDHAYVLALGAVLFDDADLKVNEEPPEEILWIHGESGVNAYRKMTLASINPSHANPDAGIFVLRDDERYLLFNASGAGIAGRGSHGHNDALSIEVSACGRAFIVDPGTYIYTGDLQERHRFRSTAYHSTVQIDAQEQNTIEVQQPFVIGNEAQPRVLTWETSLESDRVSAEHKGYTRLAQPVTHRRTVVFNKRDRWWLVEDEFFGSAEHDFAARFHLNTGIEVSLADTGVLAQDKLSGAKLFFGLVGLNTTPRFENQFTSTNYHSKESSITACWLIRAEVPCSFRWVLIPACGASEDRTSVARRFEQVKSFLRKQIR